MIVVVGYGPGVRSAPRGPGRLSPERCIQLAGDEIDGFFGGRDHGAHPKEFVGDTGIFLQIDSHPGGATSGDTTGGNDTVGGARPGNSAPSGKGLREETDGADCVAARKGLEPLTLALGKPCSIRLSYRARALAVGSA